MREVRAGMGGGLRERERRDRGMAGMSRQRPWRWSWFNVLNLAKTDKQGSGARYDVGNGESRLSNAPSPALPRNTGAGGNPSEGRQLQLPSSWLRFWAALRASTIIWGKLCCSM